MDVDRKHGRERELSRAKRSKTQPWKCMACSKMPHDTLEGFCMPAVNRGFQWMIDSIQRLCLCEQLLHLDGNVQELLHNLKQEGKRLGFSKTVEE